MFLEPCSVSPFETGFLKLSVMPWRLVQFIACVDVVTFLLFREVSHPHQDIPVVPGLGHYEAAANVRVKVRV